MESVDTPDLKSDAYQGIPVRVRYRAPNCKYEMKHKRILSSVGRAGALQALGRRFEPVRIHQFWPLHLTAGQFHRSEEETPESYNATYSERW